MLCLCLMHILKSLLLNIHRLNLFTFRLHDNVLLMFFSVSAMVLVDFFWQSSTRFIIIVDIWMSSQFLNVSCKCSPCVLYSLFNLSSVLFSIHLILVLLFTEVTEFWCLGIFCFRFCFLLSITSDLLFFHQYPTLVNDNNFANYILSMHRKNWLRICFRCNERSYVQCIFYSAATCPSLISSSYSMNHNFLWQQNSNVRPSWSVLLHQPIFYCAPSLLSFLNFVISNINQSLIIYEVWKTVVGRIANLRK